MFSSLGLFQSLPCPEKSTCKRPGCIFSHRPDVTEIPTVPIPVDTPQASTSKVNVSAASPPSSSSPLQRAASSSVPAKRPPSSSLRAAGSSGPSTLLGAVEPPRKLQKTGLAKHPVATAVHSSTGGAPVLRVSAALSQVPIPVRQTMLKTLYEHFIVLYESLLSKNPTLASEHALRQEEEVYKKSTKLTYRNAVISSIASLKRRPKPDSLVHPSVGTEAEIAAREESRKKMEALRLSRAHLEPYVLALQELKDWGYIVEIPSGPGGDRPSDEGSIKKCDRCSQQFKVKRREEADECIYHYGKPFTTRANGERRRLYTCCSRPQEGEGCQRGPHVFYESDPEELHSRHSFTHTRPPQDDGTGAFDTALDIVALDCEMIYTTGGLRVARVSVVDSSGQEIYDEFVRMDDGVEVVDFNTRFSGITEENYTKALLPLKAIRKSLDTIINANTIIIGHALDNDLKTLRMIHHRCIDTCVLFPHNAGRPYRRALKSLAKEILGKSIQEGGATVGHSSVEDSIATLDLVRWYVLNGPKLKSKAGSSSAPS